MKLDIKNKIIHSMRVVCSFNDDYEWAAELWGTIKEGRIEISDFILLKQIVSKYAVNQSLSEKQRVQYQRDSRYYHMVRNKLGTGKKLIGWVHSHNTMEAFLSQVDRGQIRNYFQNDNNLKYILSIVISINKSKLKKSSIVNRVLNRVNKDLPSIEIKLWLDGIYENKSYFNHEIDLSNFKFNSKKVMNSYIPSSLINQLREEYDDLVKIVSTRQNNEVANLIDEKKENEDNPKYKSMGFEIFDYFF